MSKLDETTGLPPLPEGHWWEVRKYETSVSNGFGYVSKQEDGYEVCVMREATIPAYSTPGKHWWSAEIVTPERYVDQVVHRKQITDPDLCAKRVTISYRGFNSETKVGKQEIAPADILKAALDIMDYIEERKAEIARRDKSDALLGAYPPKALSA